MVGLCNTSQCACKVRMLSIDNPHPAFVWQLESACRVDCEQRKHIVQAELQAGLLVTEKMLQAGEELLRLSHLHRDDVRIFR